MSENVLEVKDLRTYFKTSDGIVKSVDGISFSLKKGETLVIVGESGCGKSVTSFSIAGLLSYPGYIAGGAILLNGTDLTKLSDREMRSYRGKKISMVFQEPMTSLNPVLTVGQQLDEIFILHKKVSHAEAKRLSIELIEEVGIPRASVIHGNYPHQLSGGMRQRIVIAMALACDPDLLIADEPTTALDVTIQAQILELLTRLIKDRGKSMIFITHDLGVVAEIADNVLVMYAGKPVEYAEVHDLFRHPSHPYTQCLLASLPDVKDQGQELYSISGMVPDLLHLPKGCYFCPRCPLASEKCSEAIPSMTEISKGHFAACYYAGKKAVEL